MSPFEVLLFDLNIKVSDKKHTLGNYDIGDLFPVFIVWISYLEVLFLLCLNWSRNLTLTKNFNWSCETFVSQMINQGAKLQSIEKCILEIYGRNFDVPLNS